MASHPRPGLALAAVCLGFGLITLDATIVNVALPAIQRSLGGSLDGLQWVVDAYTVALASVLLTAGTAADRFGARRIYLGGLITLGVASVGAVLAPDLPVLIAARAAQGLAAAGLLPPTLTLIVHMFPDPRRRAGALGVWGGTSGLGMSLGPVLGGLAVTVLGWQAIFLVNIPIVVLGVALTLHSVTDTPRQPRSRLDFPGQVTGILALAPLTAGFIEASRLGWGRPVVLGLLGAGVLAVLLFVAVERRVAEPMLPLAVFRRHQLSAATGTGLLFNFSLYGVLFCVVLYLQQVRGFTALSAGLAILPLCAIIGANAFFAGRITARLGARTPMLCGLSAGAVGVVTLAFLGPHTPIAIFFLGSAIFGCVSLAMPAMTSVAMHALPAGQSGLASGVLNAARQTGGALGIALLGSLFGRQFDLHIALPAAVLAYLIAAGLAVLATRTDQRTPAGARPYHSRAESPNTAARSSRLSA